MGLGSKSKQKERAPADDDQMYLYVWASGWGLPSIDAESLQIITYVKFSGAPVTIVECENPWKSPNGSLPFFKHGDNVVYKPFEIASYLRQKNYSCDFGLSPKQCSDVIAYTQFVTEALAPALTYYCWVHESNYASVICPCYTKRLPWLYKFWYPEKRKRVESIKEIEARHVVSETDSAEPDVLQKARDCVTALSDKLGNQEFFLYPNSPSAVDAAIFSYLAPFLKIPLPHSPVKDLIRLTPNLERFVARVLHRYHSKVRVPGVDSAISSSTNFGTDGHPVAAKPDEASFPLFQKVSAVSIGVAIMLAFAYYNGIVNFEFLGPSSSINDGEEETNEDDENLIWE